MSVWNVVEIHLRRLRHNRVELALTFVVPVAFFSIFAMIFGGGLGGGTPRVKTVVVDEVGDERSTAVAEAIRGDASLRIMRAEDRRTITREQARRWVRGGSVAAAVVLFEETGGETRPNNLRCDLLTDASDQVAGALVGAVASRAILSSRAVPRQVAGSVPSGPPPGDASGPRPGDVSGSPVQIVDVIGDGKSNPVVSMYAAGIAVMFLLFGATGGGGVLLEERENQTLDRLLSTRLSMDQLLVGKWLYITALGIVQVAVMFAWAQLLFGVDVIGRIDGLLLMTVVTSGAAASLGLFLATLCRTRGQLNGLSVILVLTMSALGGSMVPRYLMSDELRRAGLWTFNAWALDGYDKLFWRDLPAATLGPQLAVLMVSGLGLMTAARVLAVRWERD